MLRMFTAVALLAFLVVGLAACNSAGDDSSERFARDFLEAVSDGDQAAYDRMLSVPSSEDSATAAAIQHLATVTKNGYEIDHVTPLVEDYTAVFVHVSTGDSDPGYFETLTISNVQGEARVDPAYSSALKPGAFE